MAEDTKRYPIVAGYEIRSVLGKGPLGTVYRARNMSTKGVVVFRAFAKPHGADSGRWREAINKFRMMLVKHHAVDAHPNIQKIISFGDYEDIFFVISEFFEGLTLRQVIDEKGALPYHWVAAVFKQVGLALDFAAAKGLAHTDITPYNILITNHDGTVRVINFGLAHTRNKTGSAYVSPEQLSGWEGDRISDVYSAGAVMYEMLAGKAPFQGTPAEIARQVKLNPPPIITSQPRHVRDVIRKMMDKDRLRRYASVNEAVVDLDRRQSPRYSDAHTVKLDPNVRLADATRQGDDEPSIYEFNLEEQDMASVLRQYRPK